MSKQFNHKQYNQSINEILQKISYELKSLNTTERRFNTTFTALIKLTSGELLAVSVGDSRIYCHNKRLDKWFLVTSDNTAVFPRSPFQVETFFRNSKNEINNALGFRFNGFQLYRIDPNLVDRVVLCTDGVWGKLTEREKSSLNYFLKDLLNELREMDPVNAVKRAMGKIFYKINAQNKDKFTAQDLIDLTEKYRAGDNATVVVVDL